MRKKWKLIVAIFCVLCVAGFLLGSKDKEEKSLAPEEAEEVAEGAAGSAEVLPDEDELRAAMLPSLKKLGKGKTIRILFQAGGDSDTPVRLKEFIEDEVGMKITVDIVPPQQMHERQVMSMMSGTYEYDMIET